MEKTESSFVDVHDLLDESLSLIHLELANLKKIIKNNGILDEESSKKLNNYTRTLTMVSRAYQDFDPGKYGDDDLEHLANKAREAMERQRGTPESKN